MVKIDFEEDKVEPILTKMTMTGTRYNGGRHLMTDENVDAQVE